MKVLSCSLENFSSYKELSFDFNDRGLTLIQGPNGSGKSTLCDAVPWVLFGHTAKNGSVDEVLNWTATGPTTGEITVEVNDCRVYVSRIRSKSKNNDLWFSIDGGPDIRGSDLSDTQRLIDDVLGMNCELYLASAYFHEFSQTASFFTANAKVRRAISEQIVDLSLSKDLQVKLTAQAKAIKSTLKDLADQTLVQKTNVDSISKNIGKAQTNAHNWYSHHESKKAQLKLAYDNFEKDKEIRLLELKKLKEQKDATTKIDMQKLSDQIKPASFFKQEIGTLKVLSDLLKQTVCEHCGAPKNNDKVSEINADMQKLKTDASLSNMAQLRLNELKAQVNPYIEQLEAESKRQNTYAIQYTQLLNETNPYEADIESLKQSLADTTAAFYKTKADEINANTLKSDVEALQSIVASFRSVLMETAIQSLEEQTNQFLSKYFDAELAVALKMEDADKLEVEITKDGNTCSFSQLSKGQRQLLKLCFGVSVMKYIKKHNQLQISSIFLDEAFDGLDSNMKLKVFNLLQTLAVEYPSVFVVEHSSELKAMFDNQLTVSSVDGYSEIE